MTGYDNDKDDNKDSAGGQRATNTSAGAGQLGQESQNRTSRWERKERTERPGYDRRTGQPRLDN
jgi:hypothetical protein